MAFIYHITTQPEWSAAKTKGLYSAPSLEAEGFIHCSDGKQVNGVLERYFQGKYDLLKLVIDTEKLGAELKYEWAESVDESFPHVYGPINLDAIVQVQTIDR